MNFNTVAVLGFGTMGSGIALTIAQSGRNVVVLETDQKRLDAGYASIEEFLTDGISRGKYTEDQKQQIKDRVSGVLDLQDLAGADLVIEAVTEDLSVKQNLLNEVATVVGTDTPLVTNTSALSVTELAAGIANPSRVAGLHFFNPVPLMDVVEVVKALQTTDELGVALEDFVGTLNKTSIPAKDRPGFLINWLLLPYLNDVIQAYDDELASAHDIDKAIRLGLGYKTGPLELMDMIGLDVHLQATTNAYEATHDHRFAAPPLLQQMVTAGYLGDKSERGFRKGEQN